MPEDEELDDLMLRWEAARQEGAILAPEALCVRSPHLLEEVARRIRAILQMERTLGIHEEAAARPPLRAVEREHLPRIPGYEILGVLDQGGMGIVYEADQLRLGRKVAVKMIAGPRLGSLQLGRFRAEAEAAGRLQHPNVVQIYEVGQVNGRPFFSMEYLDGGSLADRLAGEQLSARQAAHLVETLALAAHAAHERGIVHRDLKPSNVLFTLEGIPKIADFGLAKRLDEGGGPTQTGEILGTPSYMAPEQAEGKKSEIGPLTDVFALGAILYEILAGKPPFLGSGPVDSLRKVIAEEPTPPSRLRAGVPRDLEAICLKCLEKQPGQRYGSALDLAVELRRFLDGRPILARRQGTMRRIWKGIQRNPQGAALIGALLVLALIPLAYLIEHHRKEREIQLNAVRQAPRAREILERNCYQCHGQDPSDIQKDLDVLSHARLLDSQRKIVVPGSPEDSRLIQRIADGSMPPEEEEIHLPRLSEEELTILKEWIQGGAPPLPGKDADNPTPPVVPYSELAARTKAIFIKHCYQCHRHDEGRGGIKILHHRLLLEVRKVVTPGDPNASELFRLITAADEEHRMPPAGNTRLSPEEIATIREWILDGAAPFPRTAP